MGCTEFDCKTTTGQCGMAAGFCDTLPAKMQIDSVRVYQDLNNSRQSVGCNPPKYPTSRFIKAHASRYLRPMKVLYVHRNTASYYWQHPILVPVLTQIPLSIHRRPSIHYVTDP